MEPRYDLNPANIRSFMRSVQRRSQSAAWTTYFIFTIPGPPAVTYHFFDQYGVMSLALLQNRARTTIGQQTRLAQNAKMASQFVFDSLTDEAQNRVQLKVEDWSLEIPSPAGHAVFFDDAMCLLKIIIGLAQVETPFTIIRLERSYQELDKYMLVDEMNIIAFNERVKHLDQDLAARGITVSDPSKLLNLWRAYSMVTDEHFMATMKRQWSDYEGGFTSALTPATFMNAAETIYNMRNDQGLWKEMSAEQKQIVALKAEVERVKEENRKAIAMVAKTAEKDPDKPKGGASRGRRGEYPAWKLTAPKKGESSVKKIEGKDGKERTYHWCQWHELWTSHDPEACKLNPKNKEAEEGKPEPKLKLAMMAAAQDDETIWGYNDPN